MHYEASHMAQLGLQIRALLHGVRRGRNISFIVRFVTLQLSITNLLQNCLSILENRTLQEMHKNVKLSRGQWSKMSSALREASKLEASSLKIVLPDSTTVFFLPSSAWEGLLRSSELFHVELQVS